MAKSTFAIDVEKFGAKTVQQARSVIRRVVLDVFSKIIEMTPVGNSDRWKGYPPRKPPPGYVGGRLRGNWQTTVGRPAEGVLDRKQPGSTGASGGESILVTTAWNGEGSIFLTNNLPYAEAIEDGHSTVAPVGMVRVTMAEYPGIVERRAREAKGK